MLVTPETCRICLGKQHLNKIFLKGRAEKIKYCASVQISEDDELPKMICNQCVFYLDIAYVFKTVCEATDARLRLYFEEEKKKEEDLYFYINSPVANEVVIGDDVPEEEEEEIYLPVETVLQESTTTSVTEKQDLQQNTVPERIEFSESEEEIQLPSMEKIIQELCVTPVDEMMNSNKNVVPEESPKSDDSRKEANKLGRHTARKKLANVQKRIPTVEDKSTVSKCKIPEKKDGDTIKNGKTEINKNTTDHTYEQQNKESETSGVKNDKKMQEVKIIVHQLVQIKPPNNDIENVEKKPSKSPKSKVTVERINEIPAVEEKKEEIVEKNETDLKQNESLKSYKCDVCEKSFPYKSHLERHSSVHSGVKEFKCTDCDKKFVKQYNLTVHIEKHTGKFRHKCKECGQGFPSPSVLKRHMNSHSKSATFQCKYCPKKMLHLSSLKIHEKMHLSRPSYSCDICFKEFSYTSSLTEHKKIHQRLKGNVCVICGKQFARKTSLRRHMVTHKPKNVQSLQCDECHKHFKSKELLNKHLKQHPGLNRKL